MTEILPASRPRSTRSPRATGRTCSPSRRLTATVYGDERYNDRLDDPGPEGRAAARRLMERVWREAAAVPEDGLPTEDRITRDMLQVVAEAAIEADDLALPRALRSWTRSTARRRCSPS